MKAGQGERRRARGATASPLGLLLKQLLDELLSYPDVPRRWRTLFTVLASLGTPYDITLHELRIECFFAADEPTEEALRRLAATAPS